MDPLRDGTIFRLDRDSLNKIRSPPLKSSPMAREIQPIRPPQPIAGIREKFEDLYRSTPNPLLALTGKSQLVSYRSSQGQEHSESSVCSIDSQPIRNDDIQTVTDKSRARANTSNIEAIDHGDEKGATGSDTQKVDLERANCIEKKTTNSKQRVEIQPSLYDPDNRRALWDGRIGREAHRASKGDASISIKRKRTPNTVKEVPCHAHLATAVSETGERHCSSSSKKRRTPRRGIVKGMREVSSQQSTIRAANMVRPRSESKLPLRTGSEILSRKRGQGQVNSLSFLNQLAQTKSPSHERKPVIQLKSTTEVHEILGDDRETTQKHQSKGRVPATAGGLRSAESSLSPDCQLTNASRILEKSKRGPPHRSTVIVTAERRPDTKKARAKSAVSKLRHYEQTVVDDAEVSAPSSGGGSREGRDVRGSRRSGGDGLVGIGCTADLISGRTRSRVKIATDATNPPDRAETDPGHGRKRTRRSNADEETHTDIAPAPVRPAATISVGADSIDSCDRAQSTWSSAEVMALRTAHKNCEITAPNFWNQVAEEVSRLLTKNGGDVHIIRSANECQAEWFDALMKKDCETTKKSKSSILSKPKDEKTASDTAPTHAKGKRRTKAHLRTLLEEAFVSKEDDIFDSRDVKFCPEDIPLSPTSLRAINCSTVYVESPLEVNPDKAISLDGTRPLQRPSAWQANYVNKMKKTSKSAKRTAKPLRAPKRARKEPSLVQSGDAVVERDGESQVVNIKARISDSGRVNIAFRGDGSGDDANVDDYLYGGSDDDSVSSDENGR